MDKITEYNKYVDGIGSFQIRTYVGEDDDITITLPNGDEHYPTLEQFNEFAKFIAKIKRELNA